MHNSLKVATRGRRGRKKHPTRPSKRIVKTPFKGVLRRQIPFALAVAMVIGAAAVLVWRVPEAPPEIPSPQVGRSVAAPSPSYPHVSGKPENAEPQGPAPLWRAVDERAVAAKPPYAAEWSEEGRVLVDVSGAADEARFWRVGDRLTLPVPQIGEVYESTIDRIDKGADGSRSVRALAVGDDGRSRRTVVTVGPFHMFAYLDTQAGPYELVADTRLGWLLPSSSMMAGIDFSEPDYILPPERSGDGDAS